MKTTDREMLLLAAKAYGHEVARWTDDETALLLVGVEKPWNSLTENTHSDFMGDALRLAVKLHMLVDGDGVAYAVSTATPKFIGVQTHEKHRNDPCSATCRAITRAAAEIARNMP